MAKLRAALEAFYRCRLVDWAAKPAPIENAEMIETGRPRFILQRFFLELARFLPLALLERVEALIEFGARAEH